ncbi:hypothetical protein JVT61DRAFT_12822 [Boletus reticuloceps]|uniref:Uncharacterized protein n=1 Tax=Boletus reticuloceps TaxID=495285 RepID=A0A8I2YWC3_9AGAM|nr:hypothetical protein JVT61DRAFT_12822 [Boletus reticuloceps]
MLTIGSILYVALLLINAVAVLSEDRFLARSAFYLPHSPAHLTHPSFTVGWASTQPQNSNAGFHQSYDQSGYGYAQQDVGVKVRIINLISAVRTLMRSKRVLTCTEKVPQTLM